MKKRVITGLALGLGMLLAIQTNVVIAAESKIALTQSNLTISTELFNKSTDDIEYLQLLDAQKLFKEVYPNEDPTTFTEKDLKTILLGLLVWYENTDNQRNSLATGEGIIYKDGIYPLYTGGYQYTRDIGVACIRDPKYPPTSSEVLGGGYYREVDFATKSESITILSAAKGTSSYNHLKDFLISGASSATITKYVVSLLGLTTSTGIKVTSGIVGAVTAVAYNYISQYETNTIESLAKKMTNEQYLKVRYFVSLSPYYKVYREYSLVPKTTIISNPLRPFHVLWYGDEFGKLYR